MKLAVVSHKICRPDAASPSGFATDGGFPRQMAAIASLFDETTIVVPCEESSSGGLTALDGRGVSVAPLDVPQGSGLRRKAGFPLWLARNAGRIWREVGRADAVHAPIPGDIGTIGAVFALMRGKPLFIRHCGNWTVTRTAAERFWKRGMEALAGPRRVMLATGGSDLPPSPRTGDVRWIFSTSLTAAEIAAGTPRNLPNEGEPLRLVAACRQEPRKGTDVVIDALPAILEKFPLATLDVAGDGSLLGDLKARAARLGVADKVTFHGKLPQSEVVALMRHGHVFCFPTSASEGFPKVALEALASGLPVVTSRVSVLPKLIEGGGGTLLDAPTPARVAEAVANICADPDTYRAMSSAAIETARRFSLEAWSAEIRERLEEAGVL